MCGTKSLYKVTDPSQIASNLILCEGFLEVSVIRRIVNPNISVLSYEGRNRIREGIEHITIHFSPITRFDSITIIHDAEQDIEASVRVVRRTLSDFGLPAPDIVGQYSNSLPSIGIYTLPDCINAGMFDDLLRLAAQRDAIHTCIESYISCIGENGVSIEPIYLNKTYMEVWAAARSMNKPDKPLHQVISDGHFDEFLRDPCFEGIKSFLRQIPVREQ